jgi:membrane fusion protein (multidrug efflux system)
MRFVSMISLLAAILLFSGCSDSEFANAKEKKQEEKEVVPVEIAKVQRGDIEDLVQFNATLETENAIKVYSRVEGMVISQPLEEGIRVRKGQIVVKLDGREQLLARKKADVNYRKQLSEFNRLKALHDKELISADEFEKVKLTLEQYRLEYESAELNYEYTSIAAPISGVISMRAINLGDKVSPGTNVFDIVNFDEKIAKLYVPEKYIARIRNNITALFTSDIMPGVKILGYVKRISPVVDPASGTFKVTVGLSGDNDAFKPGMFVNVQLVTDVHENTLYLPKTALVYDNDKTYFYTVEDDSVAIKHLLNKGFEDNARVEVKNKLNEGQEIIIVGQSGLKDSSLVRIVNKDAEKIES